MSVSLFVLCMSVAVYQVLTTVPDGSGMPPPPIGLPPNLYTDELTVSVDADFPQADIDMEMRENITLNQQLETISDNLFDTQETSNYLLEEFDKLSDDQESTKITLASQTVSLDSLQEKNQHMMTLIEQLSQLVQEQNNTNKLHNEKLELHSGTLEQHENTLQQQHEALQQLSHTLESLREENKQLNDVQTTSNVLVQELVADQEKLINSQAGVTSFAAIMTVGILHPKDGDVIPFNSTLLNKGSHYNTTTSVFTCPHHALYFFSFSIQTSCLKIGSGKSVESSVSLMLNDQVILKAIARNDDTDCVYAQLASTVVTECPSGGRVWLQSQRPFNSMFGLSTDRSSLFNGFLLHELNF